MNATPTSLDQFASKKSSQHFLSTICIFQLSARSASVFSSRGVGENPRKCIDGGEARADSAQPPSTTCTEIQRILINSPRKKSTQHPLYIIRIFQLSARSALPFSGRGADENHRKRTGGGDTREERKSFTSATLQHNHRR